MDPCQGCPVSTSYMGPSVHDHREVISWSAALRPLECATLSLTPTQGVLRNGDQSTGFSRCLVWSGRCLWARSLFNGVLNGCPEAWEMGPVPQSPERAQRDEPLVSARHSLCGTALGCQPVGKIGGGGAWLCPPASGHPTAPGCHFLQRQKRSLEPAGGWQGGARHLQPPAFPAPQTCQQSCIIFIQGH